MLFFHILFDFGLHLEEASTPRSVYRSLPHIWLCHSNYDSHDLHFVKLFRVANISTAQPPTMAEPIKKAVEQLGEQIQEVTEQVRDASIAATESATPAASTESATPATSENIAPNAPNLQKDEETGEMISKSELKKRIKAREAAKKKADKLAAAPVVAKKKEVVDVSDLNPNQYFEMRSRQIKGMLDTKEEKTNPWV